MFSSVNTRVLTCGGIGRLLPAHTGLSPARSGQRENPITGPNSSLYDRLPGRTARNSGKCGPECAIDLLFRPYLRSFSGEGWGRQDQLPLIPRLPLHHYTEYPMHLITM